MLSGKAASSSPKLEGDRRRSSRVGEGQRLVNKELDGRLRLEQSRDTFGQGMCDNASTNGVCSFAGGLIIRGRLSRHEQEGKWNNCINSDPNCYH